MQPDQITTQVDEANDGTIVPTIYDRAEEYLNRSVYFGNLHTLIKRVLLALYRTPAKPTGNYRGVAKTSTRLTTDIDVLGIDGVAVYTKPLIVTTEYAIPVGASIETIKKARQENIALQDLDAVMDVLHNKMLV